MLAQRRTSRRIRLGTVDIGGDAPISIQSMTTTKTEDISATPTVPRRMRREVRRAASRPGSALKVAADESTED